MLQVKNLYKTYSDGTKALKNISFEVSKGDFLVIIGLSGSGKSTLLRCINRLIEADSGEIIFNNSDIRRMESRKLRQARSRIGMIFQDFNLIRKLTVMKNVLSGRLGHSDNSFKKLFYSFPEQDINKAEKLMSELGILELADKKAEELSGGQQQRTGIARAMMQDPELILADEPVASLDPVLAHSIMKKLEMLNKKGITVICSLHYLDLVQQYASRVIGLKDGKLVYAGTKEDIRSITDADFKKIYGKEAEKLGSSR